MSKRLKPLFFAMVISLAARSVAAHHSFSPVYDGSRTVSKEGTLTELRLVNPHVMMALETTDDSGKPAVWTVETVGRLNLVAAGFNEDSLKPGDHVTIFGNPTHGLGENVRSQSREGRRHRARVELALRRLRSN